LFAKENVEVIAVFREEQKGVQGLEMIKKQTKTEFALALDTGAKNTAAYSPGRRKFDSYVVDKTGVIRGIVSGDVRNRAKSQKLLSIISEINSAPAESGGGAMSAEKAVERAVLDYVEGIYNVKPELIERSVHKNLAKFGFGMAENKKDFRPGSVMTYDQLYKLAGSYNKEGKIAADAPKEVKVLEVSEKIAMAKLTASWGMDYFHLVKQEGQWKILQIVWQSKPAMK